MYSLKTLVTSNEQVQANVKLSAFKKEAAENASKFDWENIQDSFLRRQFEKMVKIGTAKLPEDEVKQVENSQTRCTTYGRK